MQRPPLTFLTLVAALSLGTPMLWAQRGAPQRRPGRVVEEGQIMSQFFRIRVERIQHSLGLPEDRARALAERWGRWDREVMDRLRQLNEARHLCNQVLMGPESEDVKNARIRPLLDRYLQLRHAQQEAKHRFEEEILVNLTPAQKVRLILLVEDIQPKLREMLRNSQGGRGRY